MKKRILILAAVMLVSAGIFTGCSQKPQQGIAAQSEHAGAEGQMPVSGEEEAEKSDSEGAAEEDAKELKGEVVDMKDFMFTVTDEEDISYAFAFEEKPKGLDEISVGDKVVVKYTGTLSEIDAFMGEVLSVEKQK